MQEKQITVKGMSCEHCRAAVTKAVQDVDGVENVTVNLDTGRVTYAADDEKDALIRQSVEQAGYDVES
ncbi:Copper chaperone CopZ [Paucidesulfovibrio gracilis DSM 16080]|uniref:Copper chaperone CopZ n=1 Tax=Paucidesulfovibrio gracilis DSM 16080 TaxID=1121449 RepID=A0A1T4Y4N9_9BACT|nr:cation transporter [Paucidesulfovibrio gracilis]SKA96749.1 Copper chaperone CopZ [Paucidesulfovibrio gracilis DSM 16080]